MRYRHLLIFLFFSPCIFAQDSLTVKQVKSVLFENRYVFYPNGIFKHYFQTDDGQFWYGTGNYKDQGRKRILNFKDADLNFKRDPFPVHYETNFKRTLIRRKNGFKSEDFYYTSKKKFVRFESLKN